VYYTNTRIEELQVAGLYEVEPVAPLDTTRKGLVAVVDPFSTGAVLAAEVCKAGFDVIAVYSANLEQLAALAGLVPEGLQLSFAAVIGFDKDVAVMAEQISSVGEGPVLGVLAGTETGVELADKLSEFLGLRTNGSALSEARRNKYVIQQLKATTWNKISKFIDEWQPEPFKVIVKPMDSAGSDGVTLCHSMEDVQAAFMKLIGKVNGLGLTNRELLVQEYLEGQEYVVDTVSCDGHHKVVAIWAYDRRATNGADFVNFGQRLLTADEPYVRELIDYQLKVLDALGIRHGATHGEVKWCKGEPVLVEVGARCHGVEGAWKIVCDAVYGYNQVEATVQAYFFPEQFVLLPDEVRFELSNFLLFLLINWMFVWYIYL
jgi:predicted ATP-grasp superfamily ATP-dependent carboligase